MPKHPGSQALLAGSPRGLLLAGGASLALAAFAPTLAHAAPPDGENHVMTNDSPELAADRDRALEQAGQDRDAALQEREQQRREDATGEAAPPSQAAQSTTHTVNPLAEAPPPAAPEYVPPPGTTGSTAPAAPADAAPLPLDRANGETERSGSTAASVPAATNWSEDGKAAAQSGSSAAPGGVPGENAADPLAAPRPVSGELPTSDAAPSTTPPAEGGASVIPDAERVDR